MKSFSVLLSFLALVASTFAGSLDIVPGEYHLEWVVNANIITVSATAKTRGYVGFGISPFGSMMEADVIISGQLANGTGYIQDSHAFANARPIADERQNVVLIDTSENTTHTTVTFSRQLDTGDEQDKPLLNETQFIIWSWGPTDNLDYHGPNRGTVSLNMVAN